MASEEQYFVAGAVGVEQNPEHHGQMRLRGVLHELGRKGDSKCNLGMRKVGHMTKSAKDRAIASVSLRIVIAPCVGALPRKLRDDVGRDRDAVARPPGDTKRYLLVNFC